MTFVIAEHSGKSHIWRQFPISALFSIKGSILTDRQLQMDAFNWFPFLCLSKDVVDVAEDSRTVWRLTTGKIEKECSFLCYCHEIYRVETFALFSKIKFKWKNYNFCDRWNFEQFLKKTTFCQWLVIWSLNLRLLFTHVTHKIMVILRKANFISTLIMI